MATLTTTTTRVPLYEAQRAARARTGRRRCITREAGHALEILGHAIEYLTDELVNEGKRIDENDPQLQAIQILMALNRRVYYECPFAPTLTERLRAFFHIAPPAGSHR